MTPDEHWLSAMWPFVRDHLPPPPAEVLEIGCGPLGGFVPALEAAGHAAVGVDPEAPEGPAYRRTEFESHTVPRPVGAVVACTSLHHVGDVGAALDHLRATLLPGGTLVVVEWAWERWDEATARWCFDRLGPPEDPDDPGWTHRRRDGWLASGLPWPDYLASWAEGHGIHPSAEVLTALDARFERLSCTYGPYFFRRLPEAEPDERAAIGQGAIEPTCIRYVGRKAA
ncbi:methyltransferase domain-containing protein [Spirillospora sp. NPDC047279]|uniref:class I SAM-dependent methyltransferase n=1 Tax=Spirillospora sp. NPDC047279 TaxID=3155478 RepID=UPI0033F7A132